MKVLNKTLTVAVAMMMLCTAEALNVSASVTTYDDCDVDHNGVVDISDAVAVSRFLIGDFYATDYNRFDTNKNLIVDEEDNSYVISKVVNSSYSYSYFSRANNQAVPIPSAIGFQTIDFTTNTAARIYRRYSFETNMELTPYDLTPSTETVSNQNLAVPYGIIGNDTRQRYQNEEEVTGIVRIGANYGFIIDDHTIVTSASAVFSRDQNDFKKNYSVILYNKNGTLSTKALHKVEVRVPEEYGTASISTQHKFNYAVIIVSDDLSNYTHFNLGMPYNLNLNQYSSIPLIVPSSARLLPNYNGSNTDLTYGEGRFVGKYGYGTMTYSCDTAADSFGAPVYTITELTYNGKKSYIYTAIAINCAAAMTSDTDESTGLYNIGNLITKYQLQFFGTEPPSNNT